MPPNHPFPKRKTPIHLPPSEMDDRSTIVFVTICSARRKKIFAANDSARLIVNAWIQANEWLVGRYVILPDHIHFFCAPSHATSVELKQWVNYWKSFISRQWPRLEEQPIWEKSFWDRQLRRGESYSIKWDYVRHNPVRHGLVKNPDAWPYQGELNELLWHDP